MKAKQEEKKILGDEILKEWGIYKWEINNNNKNNFPIHSSGSYFLDKALGTGGWPQGKICEIFGNDSSGKSTIALHAIAEAQKEGKCCVYVDLENTLNVAWAEKIGVQANQLYICSPDCGDQTFRTLNMLVKSNKVDLIIVDSVAAMVPKVEMNNDIEDQTMGLHARLMGKGLRILQSNLINSKTTVIFINQLREKMSASYMQLTTTTGGRALKYAASVRVEVKRCESIKNQEKIIGFITKATVVKNKFAAPMITANMALYFDSGFDNLYEIILAGIEKNLIEKKGSWFSYKGENIAQGITETRNKLRENKKLFESIKNEVFLNN